MESNRLATSTLKSPPASQVAEQPIDGLFRNWCHLKPEFYLQALELSAKATKLVDSCPENFLPLSLFPAQACPLPAKHGVAMGTDLLTTK